MGWGGSADTQFTVLQNLSSQFRNFLRCPLVAPLKVFEENNFEKTLANIGALGGT